MSSAYDRAIKAFMDRQRRMVRACGVGCCCSGAFVVGYTAGAMGWVSAAEIAAFVLALVVPVAIATAAAVMVLVMLAACLQPVLCERRRAPYAGGWSKNGPAPVGRELSPTATLAPPRRHPGRLDVYG